MGERHHPSQMQSHIYEETSNRLDSPEYTADWFVCGLCGLKTSDIESYVKHMVLKEQCVLHLCPSSSIRDLLLPRFSKKKRVEKEELDIKHVKDLVPAIHTYLQEGNEMNEEDIKMVIQASEIETGHKRRWKCQVCSLTFSRRAAVLNHFKLQHTVPGMVSQESSLSGLDAQDLCVKKEIEVDCKAPVKHIVAVESNVHLKHLSSALAYSDKTWNKPACHLCGQTFKTGKILRTHIAVVHSQGRPFHCSYDGCSQSFKTKGSLTRHERRHTGERPFACHECGRCFRESGSLARHQQSRVSCVNKKDSQIPMYGKTCPLDSSQTEKKPFLQDMKLNNILKQEVCGQLSDDELQKDMTPWNGTQAVKQEDGTSQSLQHSTLPENTSPLVPCKIEMPLISGCLADEDDLEDGLMGPQSKDINSKDLDDVKPPQLMPDIMRKSFTCPVCCQKFSRRSALALHMKTHLDELGGKCNECGKSFANKQALSRHLSSHSSVRQFVCQLCKKDFKLLNHARAHLQTHTTMKTIPCRHCGNLFKTKSARNMHERTHDNVRAFVCIECRKAFVTKASLIRHLRIHSGEAPFHCRFCGHGFKEHGTLSRHLKHKMPCAQQAILELETGDLGIRLLQGTNQKMVKDETCDRSQNCIQQTDEEPKSNEISHKSTPDTSMSDPFKEHHMEDMKSFSTSLLDGKIDQRSMTEHLLLLGEDHTSSSLQLEIDQPGIAETAHQKHISFAELSYLNAFMKK
ncbi:uncharacterized protein [Panulirus ornatus]|uniref:uncharacterized protein n=1 Tax=Panulirus ornatus TaxID=150431 RepID=UPI003A8981D8